MASSASKVRTNEALKHLQSIKPTDGYTTESYLTSDGITFVRLKRRSVALTDSGYHEIVHDLSSTGCIVGVTSYGVGNVGRGVVLVERDGIVCRDNRELRVTLKTPSVASSAAGGVGGSMREEIKRNIDLARRSSRSASGRSVNNSSTTPLSSSSSTTEPLSDEENKRLLRYIVLGILALTVIRALVSALMGLYLLALPLLYVYAVSTSPSHDSFDAKKELKRVLRGESLPEDHPDKPKDWLSQTMARVAASVTTEIAGLGGYEVTMQDFLGAFTVTSVRLIAAKQDFYWVGIFGKWRFVTRREVPSEKND